MAHKYLPQTMASQLSSSAVRSVNGFASPKQGTLFSRKLSGG